MITTTNTTKESDQMSIEYKVRTQYRADGTLFPPDDLPRSDIPAWQAEATKILMEELQSV